MSYLVVANPSTLLLTLCLLQRTFSVAALDNSRDTGLPQAGAGFATEVHAKGRRSSAMKESSAERIGGHRQENQGCRIVAESNNRYFDAVHLKTNVSPSHTRFTLSNFCLNNFGPDGSYLADLIDFCADTRQLQEVLNTIRDEVHRRFPDRLPMLVACVREVNETAADSYSAPAAPAPTATAPSPAVRPPAPKRAAQAVPMGSNTPAVAARAVALRSGALPQLLPTRDAATDPLELEAGVSLAQARFTLSEFCLDQFGARAQQLMDSIARCADVAALQKALILIGADVQERHRECLPKLIDCVREINETSD